MDHRMTISQTESKLKSIKREKKLHKPSSLFQNSKASKGDISSFSLNQNMELCANVAFISIQVIHQTEVIWFQDIHEICTTQVYQLLTSISQKWIHVHKWQYFTLIEIQQAHCLQFTNRHNQETEKNRTLSPRERLSHVQFWEREEKKRAPADWFTKIPYSFLRAHQTISSICIIWMIIIQLLQCKHKLLKQLEQVDH
jgi:hypothetical protein